MASGRDTVLLERGDCLVSRGALEHHAETKVARQPGRIHALGSDGVQADTDAHAVEPDFAEDAGLGDHFDGRLVRLLNGQNDQILLLRLHPLQCTRSQHRSVTWLLLTADVRSDITVDGTCSRRMFLGVSVSRVQTTHIPILRQEARVVFTPRQGRTPITEEPEIDLRPHVQRDDIRDGSARTLC